LFLPSDKVLDVGISLEKLVATTITPVDDSDMFRLVPIIDGAHV
jgi:hypothetical protein